MPQLKDLRKPAAAAVVPFNGEDVNITFDPNEFTPEVENNYVDLANQGKPSCGFVQILMPLLLSWDVKDGSETVPITEEVLMGLPTEFLSALIGGIAEIVNPKVSKRKFGATSSQRAK